jgi:hypothetical protein
MHGRIVGSRSLSNDFNNIEVDFHFIATYAAPPMGDAPPWIEHLEVEDYQFIKRFVLASGSLKELADAYGVSYPTIRLRLDRLIERIQTLDAHAPSDAFQARIRLLITEGEMSARLGKELLQLHTTVAKGGRK